MHPARARASCRQSDEGGGSARHREEHALRKDPQVSLARRCERRSPESREVSRGRPLTARINQVPRRTSRPPRAARIVILQRMTMSPA
nr:hypothetical protein [Burkholderia anthina]